MRRYDSGWRDPQLTQWHADKGFPAPAAGLHLPMIEYDLGEPLAVIDYVSRTSPLPTGKSEVSTYQALGGLTRLTGETLPFMTAQYDTRNWCFRLFPHNEAAQDFLRTDREWTAMTEAEFVRHLYRLRGRYMPDLSPYGVTFSEAPWLATEPDTTASSLVEPWPGQTISQRRRNYEPVHRTRLSWRNPCLDIDLAVVDPEDRLGLVVDYKAHGARLDLTSTNMQALSNLWWTMKDGRSINVPAMVARYKWGPDGLAFQVHCLNKYARLHLTYALGAGGGDDVTALSYAVVGSEWVDLTELQWLAVLGCARNL